MPRRPEIQETEGDSVIIQEIFDTIPVMSLKTFEIVATGSTATTYQLRYYDDRAIIHGGRPPIAALVVRVVDTTNATGNPGNFRPSLNFSFDSGNVVLYEPEGLTADTRYRLTVMFVG